ncbi:MAG: twin-arginine translocation signal domain-containing protein [Chloroflexi bacterium]|nr:MAG: twin-arginine translocation signal domain-containing protein [Chloroflexota bacterium]
MMISRRTFIKTVGAAAGMAGLATLMPREAGLTQGTGHGMDMSQPAGALDASGTVGEVDLFRFDPTTFMTQFDTGAVSRLADGRTLREYQITALDQEIEIAPGVYFPAWTYNGQVPGPTFRCTEGDLLRFHFTNSTSHEHTIHFHGIHPPSMDGVSPIIEPGGEFTYEFEARPFGLHLYHCHVMPLKKHIHRGLYGTFIIDPPGGRAPAHELVMVMNGFDTNFDNENEVYAVNTVAFHYARHPVQVRAGELVRVYLANLTEFDLINSFHLHAAMFRLYRTGTNLEHFELTDNVIMGQGERHILEFTLDYPGQYMFHAHQSEFAELGWMGMFEAVA